MLGQILTGYVLKYVKCFSMLDIKCREWWFVTNKLNTHLKTEKKSNKKKIFQARR